MTRFVSFSRPRTTTAALLSRSRASARPRRCVRCSWTLGQTLQRATSAATPAPPLRSAAAAATPRTSLIALPTRVRETTPQTSHTQFPVVGRVTRLWPTRRIDAPPGRERDVSIGHCWHGSQGMIGRQFDVPGRCGAPSGLALVPLACKGRLVAALIGRPCHGHGYGDAQQLGRWGTSCAGERGDEPGNLALSPLHPIVRIRGTRQLLSPLTSLLLYWR
mmetsp:Transcript_9392/g.27373  ORF Transcript_9392/g.27373 Transcript_9392/m.27373 type:complete len:219 (+) Transcript_9392:489-1145(+)